MTELIAKAEAFATERHKGQIRKYTFEPYITHPKAVAAMVAGIGAPEAVVAAALLHDVIEDTETKVEEIVALFGSEVAALVVELTNIYRVGERTARKAKECARLAKISAWGQTIKVADLNHNKPSIVAYAPEFAKVWLPERAALLAVLTKAHPALLLAAAA